MVADAKMTDDGVEGEKTAEVPVDVRRAEFDWAVVCRRDSTSCPHHHSQTRSVGPRRGCLCRAGVIRDGY